MGTYVVGITGASGSVYARRLIEKLLERDHTVHICMTRAGAMVTSAELGWEETRLQDAASMQSYLRSLFPCPGRLFCYDIGAIGADVASGSFPIDGMVILPCSMGTLSAVARGASQNLMERAADVCLKERRTLVLVPREAPYNQIHLENMLALARYGAVIMPASPGFYSGPKTIEELVDFFAARVLDQLGVRDDTVRRWTGI